VEGVGPGRGSIRVGLNWEISGRERAQRGTDGDRAAGGRDSRGGDAVDKRRVVAER